jgi:hypothetical protein
MGFTISEYQLLGLPPLPNIYVSIKGSYQIKKNIPFNAPYQIIYTIYFSANSTAPIITQRIECFNLEQLPEPANLYTVIYNEIKQQLNTEGNLIFNDIH